MSKVSLYLYSETINKLIMAKKNQLTKADYIPMYDYKRVIADMHKDKNYKWELYFVFSVATALRVVDVTSTKWGDILCKNGTGIHINSKFHKIEKKTGKHRTINFSDSVSKKLVELYKKLDSPDTDSFIFCNKKGSPLSSQYINKELKMLKFKYCIKIDNFSTHSFRKTFARAFWESKHRSSESLILLMDVLNHSSLEMTKRYLAITADEIKGVYDNFEL